MTDIVIAGIGQTSVGEHWDISLRELGYFAIEKAIEDAGGLRPQAVYTANMLAPALSRQSHLATLLTDFAGLTGAEAHTIEAAGASGGVALRQAYMAIASGQVDAVLVVGVEKVTDQVGPSVASAFASTTDSDYEAEQGLTTTAQAALLMQRYLYEFNPPRESFGGLPITAHANGATNPNAMFRKAINEKVYARSGMVSAPLNMFDAAPEADGAAAVILCRRDRLPHTFAHPLIRVAGSSVATDTIALHDRRDPLFFKAAQTSVERALRQTNLTTADIHLFELFDSYSIYGILSLEAAGFAPRGEGWKSLTPEAIGLNGQIPVATFGGLKARGYPGGATGLYQVVEATLQLRGAAGANQVANARNALVQALGGPASTVATHILDLCD